MAQHTIIVDDITGETAHETVTFGSTVSSTPSI